MGDSPFLDDDPIPEVLRSIGQMFAEGSVEQSAIEDAALAYTFVKMRKGMLVAFNRLKENLATGVLTPEQECRLRDMGIDIDSIDFDED